jgi:hypothetical protein
MVFSPPLWGTGGKTFTEVTEFFIGINMVIPNLLIIAGTGNKSGKTTMACRIIEQFRHLKVVSVKITPHFHETTPGLALILEKPGYSVYEETNRNIFKDTSRMLQAGASRSFFAKVKDNSLMDAFNEILKQVPAGTPLICESPALRQYTEPGLFIIMTSAEKDNQKNIKSLLKLPHVEFNLGYLTVSEDLPIVFNNGKWRSWQFGI